jgi:hypothetical protein
LRDDICKLLTGLQSLNMTLLSAGEEVYEVAGAASGMDRIGEIGDRASE